MGGISLPGLRRGIPVGARALALERRRAAEQMRAFLETTTECVCVIDREWRFSFLNRRAEAEVARGRALIGVPVAEIFPDEGEALRDYYRRVLAGAGPEDFEHYSAVLGGWYEIHATAIPDGIVVSFRNISQRKQAEQDLRDAEQRFRLASRAANELIGDWDLVNNRVHWSEAL